MKIKLLAGSWDVEIFLDRSEPGYDDNVFIRIREECEDRLRMLKANEITIGITAAQARQLAGGLEEVAAQEEVAAAERATLLGNKTRAAGLRRPPAKQPKLFTKTQGRYLAFIHSYEKIHHQAPAEAELQRHFQVSPPSVHQIILALERKGLIARVPGKARSIRLLIPAEQIPALD